MPLYFVEACWDYTATSDPLWTGDYDLSFSKGERFIVVDNIGQGWLKVDYKGMVGAAPEAYVKKIEWMEAIWDYKVNA